MVKDNEEIKKDSDSAEEIVTVVIPKMDLPASGCGCKCGCPSSIASFPNKLKF